MTAHSRLTLDDNEAHYAKVLCDEVFGRSNFVTNVIWEKADSPRNSARQFSTDHDHILVYSKQPDWIPQKLARTEEANSIYTNPDDDPRGPWLPGDPYANKPYSKGRYTFTGRTGRAFTPTAWSILAGVRRIGSGNWMQTVASGGDPIRAPARA